MEVEKNMKKELIKKSLIFGTIIILLIGASVVPVVNAKQIQNRTNEQEIKTTDAFYFLNVKFDLTFYGKTNWHFLGIGFINLAVVFWGESENNTAPVGHLIVTTPNGVFEYFNDTINNPFSFRIWFGIVCHNLTHENGLFGPDLNGGFIRGSALIFILREK